MLEENALRLTDSERRFLIAMWDRRAHTTRSGRLDQILEIAGDIFEDPDIDLSAGLEGLRLREWLKEDAETGRIELKPVAVPWSETLSREQRRAFFGRWMIESEMSPVYREYCRRVHGLPLIQFNALDREQHEALIECLALAPGMRVADLGCGIGTVTEYFAERTGAWLTGIDFSQAAIERAVARTGGNSDRLSFGVGDLDSLDLPRASYDSVLAFDTLYFVRDLENLLSRVRNALRPEGRFAAFHAVFRKEGESVAVLEPAGSNLGMALHRVGGTFMTLDFTVNNREYWKRCLKATEDLRDQFAAEGRLSLWKSRVGETERSLAAIEADLVRRYLYIARFPATRESANSR